MIHTSQMRVVVVFVICGVVVCGYWLLRSYLLNSGGVATSYSLVYALGEYADSHGGRLPLSWGDFFDWQRAIGKNRFKKSEIEKRFKLLWGASVSEARQPTLIVLDESLKSHERYLNQALQRAVKVE